jgi:hypothetical protein
MERSEIEQQAYNRIEKIITVVEQTRVKIVKFLNDNGLEYDYSLMAMVAIIISHHKQDDVVAEDFIKFTNTVGELFSKTSEQLN